MHLQKRRRLNDPISVNNKMSSSSKKSLLSHKVKPHPLGVKPLGNLYFDTSSKGEIRTTGLGNFSSLEDEMVIDILRYVTAKELSLLGQTSKAFFCFCATEELWKELTLDDFEGNFQFFKTWRETYRKMKSIANKIKFVESIPPHVEGMFSDALFNRWYCSSIDMTPWISFENVDRRSNLSLEEFITQYGEPNIPVIITDIVPNWPAKKAWNKEELIQKYGDTKFKTDQGVAMKLKDYFTYCGNVQEHQPMYLFDNDFGEKVPQFLSEYQVPLYFKEDFFGLLDSKTRPSFRWILIGPPRSGSSFHKDPNATSAWNGLISGAKKWILYPPDVVPPGVFPSDDGWEVTTPESVIEWFIDFYPETKKKGAYQPKECVLRPGELLFIPSTWWHTALNLEESIAVTQNVVDSQNLFNVTYFLKSKKKQELFDEFCKNMNEKYPGKIEATLQKINEVEKPKKQTLWERLTADSPSSSGFSLFGDSGLLG